MNKIISRFETILFLMLLTVLCSTAELKAQDVTYITPDQLLPSAVFNIQNDGIYVLAAKVGEEADPAAAPTTFNGFINIASGKNVTLYLNGHTLTCSKSHKIIENVGNLTIYGTYPGGNEGGIIDGYYTTSTSIHNLGIYQNNKNASIYIDGVTIQNCNYNGGHGGAISNTNGLLEIRNSVITDCTSSGCGAAVYSSATNALIVDNTTIQRCTSTGNGGAICKLLKSDFTITNSLIEDCSSNAGGGGIFYGKVNATLQVSNTTIRNCQGKGNGGGIHHAGTGIVIFKDNSKIDNCVALNNYGGGIFIEASGKLTMENGLINDCIANTGGGIFVNTSGEFTMNGGTISSCYAVKDKDKTYVKDGDPAGTGLVGGGVCLEMATMNFNGGTITNCHAATGSGGVHTWTEGGVRAYLYINGSTCKITQCDAYSYAGCTHVGNGSHCIMYDGEVSYNTCHHGSMNENGGAFEIGFGAGSRFEIYGGKICHNQALAEGSGSPIGLGGGIFMRESGTSGGSIVISGGEISDNYAANKGGGIYARISVTVDGASILRNEAGTDGGGIFFQNTCNYFKFLSGEISGNIAGNNGGGLYFDKFESNAIELIQGTLANNQAGNYGGGAYMENSKITFGTGDNLVSFENNSAVQGGGLYILSTGTATKRDVSINNSSFIVNTATDCGGGIYLNDNGKGTLYLKEGGAFSQNTATNDGGAIYVNKIKAVEIVDGEFSGNEATNGNGGGMYIGQGNVTLSSASVTGNSANNGGGFYVTGGDVSLLGGDISNNHSDNNGGAFYVNGGGVTISDGLISGNSSVSGGGVYVNNGNFTFTNGNVEGNTATLNGGGAYVSGGDVTFKGNFNGNKAANGGGLYLGPEANMEFLGGLIINNQANSPYGAVSAGTAYHGGDHIMGCGGGIYLQNGTSSKNTTLTFTLDPDDKTFGLYTNRANMAGDDLVAEGQYTEVVLPSVREMQLYGFEGKDATPFWYQDYFTGDTGYENHPDDGRAVTNAVNYIGRFREMLNLFTNEYYNHRVLDDNANLDRIKSNYLCLTLSYNMLDITISAKYLLGHETALFQLVRHGGTEDYKYDVLLRGDKTDSTTGKSSRTLRNMPWGTYSIFPNDAWNWAYDKIAPQQNLRLGETGNYEFVFDMNHINGAEVPQHDERQPVKPSGN